MSPLPGFRKPWGRMPRIVVAIVGGWLLLGILAHLMVRLYESPSALVRHVSDLTKAREKGNLQLPAHDRLDLPNFVEVISDTDKKAIIDLAHLMTDKDFGQYASYHIAEMHNGMNRKVRAFVRESPEIRAAIQRARPSEDPIVQMYASCLLNEPPPKLAVALLPRAGLADGEREAATARSAVLATGFTLAASEAEADIVLEYGPGLTYWDRNGRLMTPYDSAAADTPLSQSLWFGKDQRGVYICPRSLRPGKLASQPLDSHVLTHTLFKRRPNPKRGRVIIQGPGETYDVMMRLVLGDLDGDLVRRPEDAQAFVKSEYRRTAYGRYNLGGEACHYKLTAGVYLSADATTPIWSQTLEASDPSTIRLDDDKNTGHAKLWREFNATCRPALLAALRQAVSADR